MVHYHLWSEPVLVEILVKSAGKAEVPEELAVLCLLTQYGYKAVPLTVRPNIDFSLGNNSFYDFSSSSPKFLEAWT